VKVNMMPAAPPLAEFDFRYNERASLGANDEARAHKLAGGIVGNRLTYRDSSPKA
jgi:hypothetical protein